MVVKMNMNFSVYGELAMRTESCDFEAIRTRLISAGGNQLLRMLHAAMGITTEVGEFIVAIERLDDDCSIGIKDKGNIVNFCEEAGDIFWYLAIYYDSYTKYFGNLGVWLYDDNEKNMDCSKELDGLLTQTSTMARTSSELVDMLKRFIFYGKDMDAFDAFKKSFVVYKALRQCIEVFQEDTGKGYHKILEDNILKLKKRYGGKFDAKRAVNRNTKKELNHM